MSTIETTIPPGALGLLDDLKMDQFPHLHGSARDHLVGVHGLLKSWVNPSHVCMGGLFHNIYGTEVFKPKAVSLDQRTHIAQIIGVEAEELAFLFCVTKRIGFFDKHADPGRPLLWDEVNKTTIVTTEKRLAALIEIEVANGIEQYAPDMPLPAAQLVSILQMAEWMRDQAGNRLSAGAAHALYGLIDSVRQRVTCK